MSSSELRRRDFSLFFYPEKTLNFKNITQPSDLSGDLCKWRISQILRFFSPTHAHHYVNRTAAMSGLVCLLLAKAPLSTPCSYTQHFLPGSLPLLMSSKLVFERSPITGLFSKCSAQDKLLTWSHNHLPTVL